LNLGWIESHAHTHIHMHTLNTILKPSCSWYLGLGGMLYEQPFCVLKTEKVSCSEVLGTSYKPARCQNSEEPGVNLHRLAPVSWRTHRDTHRHTETYADTADLFVVFLGRIYSISAPSFRKTLRIICVLLFLL
jgi:hypothetical protein